jgi:16S rRNA (guanine527-N7)-methyltransferase
VLLQKWNGAYNLTAVKDLDDMLRLHLLDSLSIAPLLDKTTYIDVGTGAGLPGLPLAIVCPDKHFTLLDTNSKRTRFMLQAKSDLGLTNITVVKARVEDYTGEADFDGVLSRAFASLIDMLKGCQHLLGPGGLFLAMKGLEPTAEYEQIPDYASLKKVYSLHVPEVNAERHLIVLEKRC